MINNIYIDILNDKKGPVEYRLDGDHMGMKNHYHPLSIKINEFNYIMDYISQNNLKRGYELATAFGISAVAIGLGMKKNNGKLVSMDSYVEEHYNHSNAYKKIVNEKYYNTDGFKSASYLINKYDLNVRLKVGWSPEDTKRILSDEFDLSKEKLDFVFIDSGHWDDAIIKDIESIKDLLDDNFSILLHDTFCFTEKLTEYLIKTFGKSYEIVVPVPFGTNMGLIKI